MNANTATGIRTWPATRFVPTGFESSSRCAVLTRIRDSAQSSMDGQLLTVTFTAMATQCKVVVHGGDTKSALDFFPEVVRWVAEFEARYSRFIPDSLIGRINAAAGETWVETDPETDRILSLCEQFWFFTHGAFDPTALPLIKLWDWKRRPSTLPDDASVRATRELVGWNKVQRRPGAVFLPRQGMCLDLGGIGKEYAVDCVMNLAIERGFRNVLVDFGHDVRVLGAAPGKKFWHIGLEDAHQPGKCWAGVAVTDHAVATSGDYIRCFQVAGHRYGHIIDPRTGYPVDNTCRAASAVAPSCTIAGLLTTTALILGPKEGMSLLEMHPGAAGAITTDTNLLISRRFPDFSPN